MVVPWEVRKNNMTKKQKQEYMKKWRLSHKEHIKEYDLIHLSEHREAGKNYDRTHKHQKKVTSKIYYETHKEQIKEYFENNRERIKEYHRKYYQKNKKLFSQKQKEYDKTHKEERNRRQQNKLKTNINYKIAHYLRTRLNKVLKGERKSESILKLLGCSLDAFKSHLESNFTQGMSFENYGKWHIDHIKPCASFDLSVNDEQSKCFHYTNLQPLWAKDNLEKYTKILQ